MSVSLKEAQRKEATRESRKRAAKNPTRADFRLGPVELADQIARAIASVPACRAAGMIEKRESGDVGAPNYSAKLSRKSSDDLARATLPLSPEGEALASMIAEALYRKRGPIADAYSLMAERDWMPARGSGSAADVLRFMRRADLALAAAEKLPPSDGIPRSLTGRKYLAAVAAGFMRDSRDWRDSAESYRTRSALESGSGAYVESYDQYANADYLTLAQARECERRTGEPMPALPLHTRDVSDALAAAVAPMSELVNVATALRAAEAPLAAVALADGIGLPLAKKRSAAGARWLRDNVPASALCAALRSAADATGHVVPADPRAPMLPASAAPASAAVDAAIMEARKLATASASPLPGSVTPASNVRMRCAPLPGPHSPSEDRKLPRDAAPFPAVTAWRVAVRALRESGCEYPHTVHAAR